MDQPGGTPDNGIDAQARERGRVLFARGAAFVRGVVAIDGLPPPARAEVAFAGRSNVGKSSLLNALAGRKALARTSRTPGRTREINFFAIGETLYLVDMPGYGYARVERRKVQAWTRLIRDYLRGRQSLRRLFLLVDARHGLKPSDLEFMALMDEAATSYQLVLTKADKPKGGALADVLQATREKARSHGAAHPAVLVTSSLTGLGMDRLRAEIAALAGI